MNALNGLAVLDTADSSRIVQLSDTHLMQARGGKLVGVAVFSLQAMLRPSSPERSLSPLRSSVGARK